MRRGRKRWVIVGSVVAAILTIAGLWAWSSRRWIYSHTNDRPVVRGTKWGHLTGVPMPPLRDPRIVIEKAERWLVVYDGDRPVKAYPMALGFGEGDKHREGDGCTPEGEFYVCMRNPKSKFTLSLGLSYPNAEDARRGLRDGLIDQGEYDRIVEAIGNRRCPPWKTPLGGEIMIHGAGASRDWTAGCIALENEDIRELYARISIGIRVTILP